MPDLEHKRVQVSSLPDCDFCKNGTKAHVDGRTTLGCWANMCKDHFRQYGIGLGLGKGQVLYLESEKPEVKEKQLRGAIKGIALSRALGF